MAYTSIRYRAYPNKKQEALFEKTFNATCFIWNKMLEDKKNIYLRERKITRITPTHYKKEYNWLTEVDSHALANVQINIERSFNHLIKKKKFPNYKSKKCAKKSYTTNLVGSNIRFRNKSIRLPKAGFVKIALHRKAPENWTLKTVTVSQEPSGKYYISVLYEDPSYITITADTNKSIGLDFAMHGLYVDSNGKCAEMPRFMKLSNEKLQKARRRLSKMYVKGKKKQSNRYYKQKHRVAILHEKIRNQRRDWLHKHSKMLIDKYDYIGIEDLNMVAMRKSLNFGRVVNDNAWSKFTVMLMYKAAKEGKHVIKVNRRFPSSQMCHRCGSINPNTKNLSIREWNCPVCGTHHQRDINAALNIKAEAIRIIMQN